MSFYQIEYNKEQSGWVASKLSESSDSERAKKSQAFSSIKDAEDWVEMNEENIIPKPWINHVIDGYTGTLIPLQEWKEACDYTWFIDSDGYGSPVDENYNIIQITDSSDYEGNHISPSDYTKRFGEKIPDNTKYILWYNS